MAGSSRWARGTAGSCVGRRSLGRDGWRPSERGGRRLVGPCAARLCLLRCGVALVAPGGAPGGLGGALGWTRRADVPQPPRPGPPYRCAGRWLLRGGPLFQGCSLRYQQACGHPQLYVRDERLLLKPKNP